MLVIGVDIETGGLKDESLLQLSAVADCPDPTSTLYGLSLDKLPVFNAYVKADTYSVNPYCLGLHADSGIWKTIQTLSEDHKDRTVIFNGGETNITVWGEVDFIWFEFKNWIDNVCDHCSVFPFHWESTYGKKDDKKRLVLAGKNVASFDYKKAIAAGVFKEDDPDIAFRHRMLDPGSIFTLPTDSEPADLKTCLKRCGVKKEIAHEGHQDILDVLFCLRHYFRVMQPCLNFFED